MRDTQYSTLPAGRPALLRGLMTRIAWWFGLVSLLVSLAAAQRLPEIATPENYKLTLSPNFEKDNFAGEETVRIRVLKPTAEIVVNAAEIEFQDVTITTGGATQKATVR
jgi:hypothetical protein